jgi:TolB-like protein/thioredoxin-like negative regulator of GroEL
MLKLAWRGDRAGAAAAVARFPSWLRQEDRGAFVAWLSAFWDRNPERALAVMRGFPRPFVRDSYFAGPAAVLTALAHDQAGHTEAARADWRIVLQLSDAEISSAPDNPAGYYWKAWASARLGDRAAAAEASAQIVQRNFAERSTFLNNFTLAPLWVALGQPDEAIHALGPSNPRSAGMTEARASLELSPFFDAIRNDQRFPALVAAAAGPETKPSVSSVAPDDKAVAVLPFANLSGDKEQEYFSDGLTEEILNALARERDLRVPGRASSFSFKGKNASGAEIAKALNVSRLVEGSVQRSGTKVRIRVSLTRVADNASEELGTFTEELADIFALQDKVARAVVEKLTHRQPMANVGVLTKNPEAYTLYLKARSMQNVGATSATEAVKFFERAVALDPSFALAWARMGEAKFRRYASGSDYSPEVVTGSRAAIDRALSVQPDLPEALIARANWLRNVEWNFTAAQRDLDKAESLQPATADLRFAQFALADGQHRWPEASRLAKECLALDPQNADATVIIAAYFSRRGDFREADLLLARAREIGGVNANGAFHSQVVLRRQWRGPEAALRLWDRIRPGQSRWEPTHAELLLMLGRKDEARAVLDGVTVPTAVMGFGVYTNNAGRMLVALGMNDRAQMWAEAARAEALKQFARGNNSPIAQLNLVSAEIVLGHRDSALAALKDWSAKTQTEPGGSARRLEDFVTLASGLYGRLGMADEMIALLRERAANIDRTDGFDLRYNPDYALIRNDPRFQELMQQAEAWAKAQPHPIDP